MLWDGIDSQWKAMKRLDAFLWLLRRPLFNRMTSGNRLVVGRQVALRGKASVVSGTGNLLQIGKGTEFWGDVYFRGDNNKVIIGENCRFRGEIDVKGSGQTIVFGDNSVAKAVYVMANENCDVRIGKWCLLSREIEIRTSDAHAVIDRKTRERLNPPAPVSIGDHVWIGVGAIINKGAVVPSDSIVGAMSFVNGRFDEEGVVLAGTPAAIVRRGITWDKGRKLRFSQKELDRWKDDSASDVFPADPKPSA